MEETIGYEALFSPEAWDELQGNSPRSDKVKGYHSRVELIQATLGETMKEAN